MGMAAHLNKFARKGVADVAIPYLRRRLCALEAIFPLSPPKVYPPLTPPEIVDIARRVQVGEALTRAEVARIAQHSPSYDGELVIKYIRGDVFVKRYIGIDLALV